MNFKFCIDSVAQFNVKHLLIPNTGNHLRELIKIYNDVKDSTWPSVTSCSDFVSLPLHVVNELKVVFNVYDRMLELNEVIKILDYYKSVHNLLEVELLDYARDYHHFDLVTAKWLVEQIC